MNHNSLFSYKLLDRSSLNLPSNKDDEFIFFFNSSNIQSVSLVHEYELDGEQIILRCNFTV
jgi:hypothetical protein